MTKKKYFENVKAKPAVTNPKRDPYAVVDSKGKIIAYRG